MASDDAMLESLNRPMCHCGEYMDSHPDIFESGHLPVRMVEDDERETFTRAQLDAAVRDAVAAAVKDVIVKFDKYAELLNGMHLADCQFCREDPAYCPNEKHPEWIDLVWAVDAIRARAGEESNR
jgi:hypothetical protein